MFFFLPNFIKPEISRRFDRRGLLSKETLVQGRLSHSGAGGLGWRDGGRGRMSRHKIRRLMTKRCPHFWEVYLRSSFTLKSFLYIRHGVDDGVG